jgi:hypothetical protein
VLIPWNPKGKWIIFSKQFFLFAALKGLIWTSKKYWNLLLILFYYVYLMVLLSV